MLARWGGAASPRRLVAAVLACGLAIALLAPAVPAGADVFGPISLVSDGSVAGGPAQQAEYAHDSAISSNGRYVAFDGSVGGVTGVWRRNIATGAIEQVAGGDAEMPSISADGQYISFTTNEGAGLPEITHDKPDTEPKRESVNVYVRDMAKAPAQTAAEEEELAPRERAFIVVSAPSKSAQPLAYGARTGEAKSGSSAAGRSAISADGSEVAFVTTAVSNLVSYPQVEEEERKKGETLKPRTPPFQVAVRNLDSEETTLVSRCYFDCGEADAGAAEPVVTAQGLGAVYTGKVEFPNIPPTGEWPGVSLSADGSTVAWMGQDIGEQAPTLSAEDLAPAYTEPLWRRIEPGSETVTERVTGGSDPTNPQCAASGESALPSTPSASDPCQGPFFVERRPTARTGIWPEAAGNAGNFIPRLSEDGYQVAFLSEAKLVSEGEDFGRNPEGQESDLFLADMQPGYTREEALTPLTEIGPETAASSAPIDEFEISPDGGQVAFTTARTTFPLGQPAFVSAVASQPGVPELFDADLRDGTLTRVTHGFNGEDEPSEQPHVANPQEEDPYGQKIVGFGALSPSFTAGGGALAFTSTADNLVYGDGNTPPLGESLTARGNGSDVFLVKREEFERLPTPQNVSPAPETLTQPSWQLGVTALSRPDGSVLLYVEAPGSGTLRAGAQSAVVLASAHAARHAHHASRARVRETVARRTVATKATDTKGAGLTTLTLTLAPFYAALARSRGGLSAAVTVTFTAPGHPALRASLPVTFLRKIKPSRSKARSSKSRRRSSKADRRS